MISLAKVLSNKPILIVNDIYFYQPTLQEIVDIGETNYWTSLNIWTLKRADMLAEETEQTIAATDFEVWKRYILSSPVLKRALSISSSLFFRAKIEFFDISGTIFIGEKESGVILDESFYLVMKQLCERITPSLSASKEEGQYKETDNMSEREREMIRKMKASEQKIEETKNPNTKPEDYLGKRILGLVAVGGYTFEQVYSMTMLQFNLLLEKYVDIQTFELRTSLSPYISSEDGQDNKFWLD